MHRIVRHALAAGSLAVLIGSGTVAAAPPPVTVIELDVDFISGDESFTATGGVVCASGWAETDGFPAGWGRQGRGNGTFHIVKTMHCAGTDAPTFQIRVNVGQAQAGTVGGFSVVGGTGPLSGLTGGGSLVGFGYPDGSGIHDVYTGRLSIVD